MAEADAATKSGATQKLVPRALWWFRWSAAVTFLSGATILGLRRASWSDPWGLTILTGAAFGTVMLANVWRVFWFPMLFFMGAASHFTLPAAGNRGLWAVVLLVIIALLEINALVGTTGPTKKPIETVRGVIVTGVVTALLVYWIALAVLRPQGV